MLFTFKDIAAEVFVAKKSNRQRFLHLCPHFQAESVAYMSREGSGVGSSVNCLLIAATLSAKNEAKVYAVILVAGGGGGGLSRVLKVEKSFRE